MKTSTIITFSLMAGMLIGALISSSSAPPVDNSYKRGWHDAENAGLTVVISVLKEQKDCEKKGGVFIIEDKSTTTTGDVHGYFVGKWNIRCLAPSQPDIFNYEIR